MSDLEYSDALSRLWKAEDEIERLKAEAEKIKREVYQQFGIVLDQSGNGHHMQDSARLTR